jgi:hypothetical protein
MHLQLPCVRPIHGFRPDEAENAMVRFEFKFSREIVFAVPNLRATDAQRVRFPRPGFRFAIKTAIDLLEGWTCYDPGASDVPGLGWRGGGVPPLEELVVETVLP